MPPLPPKKMFGGFDEAFLQRRRHELQFWLDQVMKHSRNFSGQNIQHSRAMYQFLTEGVSVNELQEGLGPYMIRVRALTMTFLRYAPMRCQFRECFAILEHLYHLHDV